MINVASKYFFYIKYIPIILLAIIFASCQQTIEVLNEKEGYSILNIGIISNSNQDGESLFNTENTIKRLRIYAFDGDVLDNMSYYELDANNPNLSKIVFKVKYATSKNIYVIANEPLRMSGMLAMINKPIAFDNLDYLMADYCTAAINSDMDNMQFDSFCLPMVASIMGLEVNQENMAVTIPLERSIARVDVMLQKQDVVKAPVYINNSTRLSVMRSANKGYLFPFRTSEGELTELIDFGSGPAQELMIPVRNANNNDAAIRAFTFYTPERNCNTENSKLGIQLSGVYFNDISFDFDITIGNQPNNLLEKIERNKVHKVYCTFTPKGTNVDMEILDWKDEKVNGDIEGDQIRFSQNIIYMDYSLYNSFETTLTVVGSKNIEFIGYQHPIKFSKSTRASFQQITTDGSNLPPWLPVENFSGIPDGATKKCTIRIKYNISDLSGKNSVELVFRVGRLRAQVKIIYDNGYLPYEILYNNNKFNWTENTPANGIHLARRGNIISPGFITSAQKEEYMLWCPPQAATLPIRSIFYPGSGAKHGRGKINTDIIIGEWPFFDTMAYRCKMKGEKWYLPSIDEVRTVNSLTNFLGQSYSLSYSGVQAAYCGSNMVDPGSKNGSIDLIPTCLPFLAPSISYQYKSNIYPFRCIRNVD